MSETNQIRVGSRVIDDEGDRGEVLGIAGTWVMVLLETFGGSPCDPYRAEMIEDRLRLESEPVFTDLDGLPIRSTDQKPRGEKAPLALLPWDVLFACNLAPPFLQKLHDDIGLLPIDRARLASIPCERTTDYLSELLEPEAPALGVDLGDVARVFEYGSTKYAPDNWRTFEWDAASDREYWSAFLRHLLAHSRGETADPESGLPHLAHAVCCLLIVAFHEAKS